MELDWQHSCKTIQDANLYLLRSKKFTDVTFVVGDEKEIIEAHKLILMARSPVFETMFDRWETGRNCRIEVPEISGKSFRMFLKFLYGNEFVVKTANEAGEVLYLAHKYDTKELASKCLDFSKSIMDIRNAIHIHLVATKFDQRALQTQAMEFILKNGKHVIEDDGFLNIDLDTLRSILQSDKLAVDELTVFRAVMRWVEKKCEVQNMPRTIGNKRKRIVLKDIIPLIRFPLMTSQEFTDEVIGKYNGLLTDSEAFGIYMYFNTASTIASGVPKLPFNKTKRLSGTIYTVNPYTGLHWFDHSCRQFSGLESGVMCQKTLQFTPSRNIRVTGIELYKQPAGIPQFSVFVYPSNYPNSTTLMPALGPNSSTVFELNGAASIDVPMGVSYTVKLECGGGQSTLRCTRRTKHIAGSVQVNSGEESITISFSSVSVNCYAQSGGQCICSGQIKAIYFAL